MPAHSRWPVSPGRSDSQVSQTAPGHYHATTTIRQTDFGIKPYSAFLGSLKVADAVQVEVELDLSQAMDTDRSQPHDHTAR